MDNTQQAFGELRSLLHEAKAASEDRWRALCELLDDWPEQETMPSAIAYAQSHLRAWPSNLRQMPKRWQTQLVRRQAAPQLALARRLRVDNHLLGGELVEALLSPEGHLALEELELIGALEDNHIIRLSAWEGLGRLSRLRIEQAQLGASSTRALARALDALGTSRLKHLNLERDNLHDDALEALLQAQTMRTLEELRLDGNRIGQGAGALLARFEPSPQLTKLGIGGQPTPVGDALDGLRAQGLEALLNAPWLSQLKGLYLNANRLAELGAQAMSQALKQRRLDQLTELSLVQNNLGPDQAHQLAEAAPPTLKLLSLAFNPLGDQGAASLQLSELSGLETLHLFSAQLGDQGLGMLLHWPYFSGIKELDLGFNHISDLGMRHFKDHKLEALESLDLSMNRLSDDGLYDLSRSDALSRLKHLRLYHNNIGVRCCKMLASSPTLSQLTTLDLGSNPITDEGAAALAAGHWPPSLRRLSLSHAQIGPKGAEALANSGALSQLERLDLEGNPLTERGYRALAHASGLSPSVRRHYALKLRAFDAR